MEAQESGCIARAAQRTVTCTAPAAFSARAASLAVAPVVKTSSMTPTDSGTGGLAANAPLRLRRRFAGSSLLCGGVSRTLTSNGAAGTASVAPTISASRLPWSTPVCRRRCREAGTHVAIAGNSTKVAASIMSRPSTAPKLAHPEYLNR